MIASGSLCPDGPHEERRLVDELGPGAIPVDVRAEMVRQHLRFGSRASRERWITVMTEELGEIARAYLNEDVEDRPVEMSSRQELVQLTAICLRALDDWDRGDDVREEVGNG